MFNEVILFDFIRQAYFIQYWIISTQLTNSNDSIFFKNLKKKEKYVKFPQFAVSVFRNLWP